MFAADVFGSSVSVVSRAKVSKTTLERERRKKGLNGSWAPNARRAHVLCQLADQLSLGVTDSLVFGQVDVLDARVNFLSYRNHQIKFQCDIYGSTRTLIIRCTSSSCCAVHELSSASMRLRMSRGSSSRSSRSSRLGCMPNPFAIATMVSRLGTFFPRSTSPQKFPVMLPRSAASSRLSLAAFLSLLIR
jgi:hypothetical protein